MKQPRVCVLRTAGTNCDRETAFAFEKAKAKAQLVHINSLLAGETLLDGYCILVFPGGFSYGDDIASGKIFANELRYKLADALTKFIHDGKLIIGICNGFQILVKAGILPGNGEFLQEATLTINDSGKFEDRWTYLRPPQTLARKPLCCVWTKGLPEIIYLPVAHGEGKFIAKDRGVSERLKNNGQVVFQYCNGAGKLTGYPDNPNGSQNNIAGICDTTGRIMGLMPHPERHVACTQHPRRSAKSKKAGGDGLQIFQNGVDYAKKYL